jgi:hypothetical protein
VPDLESKGASEVVSHRPRTANVAGAESPDACDLLIAELEARRVRLEHLLRAVWTEADTAAALRVPIRPRAKCQRAQQAHRVD